MIRMPKELPPKKPVGTKVKYHDKLHEYFRRKAREYYWKKKWEREKREKEEKNAVE